MRLTIVYDDSCPFCCWCRDWVAAQELLVPVTLRPRSDDLARRRWGHVPGYGHEVFVADDAGHVWTGPAAFVMVLWATRAHRARSHDLTGPAARAMFDVLSRQRHRLAALVAPVPGPPSGGHRHQPPSIPCHGCETPEDQWPPPPTPSPGRRGNDSSTPP